MRMHRIPRGTTCTCTLLVGLIAGACQTGIPDPIGGGAARPTPSAPTVTVDAKLPAPASSLPPFGDGAPRPIAVVTDASGVPVEFVENEMMVETADAAALDALARRWNAVVLDVFEPSKCGMEGDPLYLLRVQTTAADRSRLADDLRTLNPNAASQLRVSSDAASGLIAAAAREATGGMIIGLNVLSTGDSLGDRNVREAGAGAMLRSRDGLRTENYDPNPHKWSYMQTGGFQNFGVAEAWSVLARAGRLGNKVKIAIVDGGFGDSPEYPQEREHYGASIWSPARTEPNQNECTGGSSCPWHGQNVVEACMGRADNNGGAAGPAGPIARCITIRRSDDVFNNIQAIGTALLSGANIINMSFGSRVPASLSWSCVPFSLATGRARAAGKLIFASAGNDNSDIDAEDCFIACWEEAWFAPAENDGVIAVGALDLQARFRRNDSNYGGEELDIWGPGYMWVGPDPANGSVHSFGATSGASPFVAGVAALIWAANPGLDNNGVERILMDTCNRGGPGEESRWPNALAAVVAAIGGTPPELSNVKVERTGFTGRNVMFTCTATDAEDGTPQVTWASDRQGLIGTGTQSGSGTLAYGRHTITCTATDRIGLSVSQTVVFELPNSAPRVTIDAPLDGQSFFAGQTVFLECYSYDLESSNRLVDSALTWTSDLDGFLANGQLATAVLRTAGTHRLALTGRDPDGATASSSVRLVAQPAPPDGVPPTAYIYPLEIPNGLSYEANGRSYVDVTFIGTAQDPEDGYLSGGSLAWRFESNSATWNLVDGNTFGTYVGCRIYTGGGEFRITLTATDRNGKTGTYTRTGSVQVLR